MRKISLFVAASALAFLAGTAISDPIDGKPCDFTGPYSGACVTALASDRPGGVLLIAAKTPARTCETLSDTANFVADSYCADIDTGLRSTSAPAAGGVPYTCDGIASASQRLAVRSQLRTLLLDGLDEAGLPATQAALPEFEDGVRTAHMKFLCVAR